MKVVVLGSLGHIGKPLTEALIKKGHSVTVITSSADRVADIEALGAGAAVGSVTDTGFLNTTLTGADVVHAMIPPSYAVPDMFAYSADASNSIVEAIRQSGIKRVVYISSYGAQLTEGVGLIKLHHPIEQALLNMQGLDSITVLRATYIYYNMYRLIDVVKATGNLVANYGGDDRVVMVDPKDIASASLRTIESNSTGTTIEYVASDVRTCNEIARVLGNAIGKPGMQWIRISNEEMQKAYESYGMPKHMAELMTEMYGSIHTNLIHEDYDLHIPQLGMHKLEEFAQEFAAAYNAK